MGIESLKDLQTIIHEIEEEQLSDSSSIESRNFEKGIPIESESKEEFEGEEEDEKGELLSERLRKS